MKNENASAPTWQTMTRRTWFALSCLWAAGWLLIALFQLAPWEARATTAVPSVRVAADLAQPPVLLLPGRAEELDGIIQKMMANKQTDAEIGAVVKDFKTKYADYAGIAAKFGGTFVPSPPIDWAAEAAKFGGVAATEKYRVDTDKGSYIVETANENDSERSRRIASAWTSVLTASALFSLGWFVRAFVRYVRTGSVRNRKAVSKS